MAARAGMVSALSRGRTAGAAPVAARAGRASARRTEALMDVPVAQARGSAGRTVPVRAPGAGTPTAPVAASRGIGSVRAASARATVLAVASVPLGIGRASRAVGPTPAAAPVPGVATVPPTATLLGLDPNIRHSPEAAEGLPAPTMPAPHAPGPRNNTVHRRTGGKQGAPPLPVETTAGHRARVAMRAADIAARTGRLDRLGTPTTAIGGAIGPRRAPVAGAGMRQQVLRGARATSGLTGQPATGPTAEVVPTVVIASPVATAPRVPVAAARQVLVVGAPPVAVASPVVEALRVVIASPVAAARRALVAGASPNGGAPPVVLASPNVVAPRMPMVVLGGTPGPRTERGPAGATGTRRTTNRPGARVRPEVPRSRSRQELIPSCWTPRCARSCGR